MISGSEQEYPDERAVEDALVDVLRRKTNLGMVVCSSQNVDGLVSIYRALKRTGSLRIIDLYTAFVLRALRCISDRFQQFDWPQVRVNSGNTTLISWRGPGTSTSSIMYYAAKGSKIEVDDLVDRRRETLVLAKANRLLPIIPARLSNTEGLELIWSMWEGYLTGQDAASRFCAERKYNRRSSTQAATPS